eukprot:SAG22_NODE_13329_length_410_cov_0.890675_1_plen_69_part_01
MQRRAQQFLISTLAGSISEFGMCAAFPTGRGVTVDPEAAEPEPLGAAALNPSVFLVDEAAGQLPRVAAG